MIKKYQDKALILILKFKIWHLNEDVYTAGQVMLKNNELVCIADIFYQQSQYFLSVVFFLGGRLWNTRLYMYKISYAQQT